MPLNPVPIENVESIVPPDVSFIILFLVAPLYVVKLPPTYKLFELSIFISKTEALNPLPIVNEVSKVPSLFNLAILLTETPL